MVQGEDAPDLVPVESYAAPHVGASLAPSIAADQAYERPTPQGTLSLVTHRMAEVLVAKALLSADRADLALRDQARTGLPFDQLVTERGWVPDDVYADVLAMTYGISRLRLDAVRVDRTVAADLDEEWVRSESLLPLHEVEGRREVLVATTNPENLRGIDALSFRLGKRLSMTAASRSELEKLVRHVFFAEPLPEAVRASKPTPDAHREVLARVVSENRQAAQALQTVFELCVERGLVSREEFERRLRAYGD